MTLFIELFGVFSEASYRPSRRLVVVAPRVLAFGLTRPRKRFTIQRVNEHEAVPTGCGATAEALPLRITPGVAERSKVVSPRRLIHFSHV